MATTHSTFSCDAAQLADLPTMGIVSIGVVGTMYQYDAWLKSRFRRDEPVVQWMFQSLRLAIDFVSTGQLDRDALTKVQILVVGARDKAYEDAGAGSMGEYYADLMGDDDLRVSSSVGRSIADNECDLMKFANWVLSACLASEPAEVTKNVSEIIDNMSSIPHARRRQLEQIVDHCKAAQQSQDRFLAHQDWFADFPTIFDGVDAD